MPPTIFTNSGERASKRKLRVAYEALAWGKHIYDYRDSWEIVRRANHPSVGLNLDTFHIFSRNSDLQAMQNIPGDRIFLVQIADAPRLSMDHLSWSRHYRCFPGQGELPLNQFMENLRATGYDGPVSLEIFNDQFRSGSPKKTAVDGYRSLVFANNATEALPQQEAEALPAISPPRELQFIEFAINQDEKARLTQLIGQLGFTHAATHRKKSVELWRQGNINLVMNLEPDSFAQAYHEQHGVSVCALGLSCKRVDKLVERAEKLLHPISYGNPQTDTHGMPAITGPGGCLLYLVDDETQPAHWAREFIQHETTNDKSYLTHIDHIATSMNYEEMLHSVLLYRAEFDMRPTSGVDLSDPGGLVKSLVMQTEDRAVSFTLNSSLASHTLSSHILDHYAGTGVNHIALSTQDIFSLAAMLKQQDTPTMCVTDNYYDDLGARFNLTNAKIKQLKEYKILYDEDEDGAYYQLYTQLFASRFCFEIIQRNGYQGFGAANAQLRMTMQAREMRDLDEANSNN